MIFVGQRTARQADHARAQLIEQRNRRGGVVVAVPHRRIQSEPARVGGADGLAGIDGKMNHGRGRQDGVQLNVIQIKSGFGGARLVLNDKAGKIVRVGHAQGRQGNRVLLPGIGQRRGQKITGVLRGVVKGAVHLKLLSAHRTAIEPKADAGEAGIRQAGMAQSEATVGVGDGDTDGIGAGMDRGGGIGKAVRTAITSIRPAVDQRIGVEGHVGLRQNELGRCQ